MRQLERDWESRSLEPAAAEALAAYEDATARTPEFFFDVMLWEIRWPFRSLRELNPQALSEPMTGYVERAEKMTHGGLSARQPDAGRNCVRATVP